MSTTIKFLSPLIRNHGLRKSKYLDSYRSSTSTMSSCSKEFCSSSSNKSNTCHQKRTMATDVRRCLNIEDLNPNIIVMEYAVRGPLVIRAAELEKELEKVRFKNRFGFFLFNYRITLLLVSITCFLLLLFIFKVLTNFLD